MTIAVLTEKPAVARDIARVLGADVAAPGCLRGNGYVVTWAIGHLVVLAEPGVLDPAWKTWRREHLPMVPRAWTLVVAEATADQFGHVRRILADPEVTRVVCATDAGREGELIFRNIYEATGCEKTVWRLWISSLTSDAIARGFRNLRPSGQYDALARAARARSRADWLVGMNLSRAYSLAHGDRYSVGRVQTPTLAMVAQREREIRQFVPEDYVEVVATFRPATEGSAEPGAGGEPVVYPGTWFTDDRRRLAKDGDEAARIASRARGGVASIESVTQQARSIAPPSLYDLTELQRHANRLFGMSAARTLDVAQRLYEERKLLSYPRTDSRHLSRDVAATLPGIVAAIAAPYGALVAAGSGTRPLGPRFVDDARVTDHHAILPTATHPSPHLTEDERRIYDLVCRRLLSAWHEDHVYAVTKVVTRVDSTEVDRFASTGTSVESVGWKVLDPGKRRAEASALPGGLAKGDALDVVDVKEVAKQTRPPPRFTDATLLTAMETAGRSLPEKELADAMREHGLGTPATRAAILEVLIEREYVVRDGASLGATDKGMALVALVHPDVKTPAMTGQWEARLAEIERGPGDFEAFMNGIVEYVANVVATVGSKADERGSTDGSPSDLAFPASRGHSEAAAPSPSMTPDLQSLLHERFGFASFRPFQEEVCQATTAGRDVLLVMPTGAGKSLCYQLPGLARGGTTLVVSPLIALMEDQVAKLCHLGLAAARIHSGRDREASRAACRAYLDGRLDYLFIAPERLKVPGFPEMLARRHPTLIAIDEAHCISQWGHDFRPDYRMLGERLPLLRPAPVIALTATATPDVQDDIVSQLRLDNAVRFIHGFRRTNLAVEVVETNPGDRADAVCALLADPARVPAIIYAPTRREAESLARRLAENGRAAPYHAGMPASERAGTQRAFLDGEVPIIVATVAFGMGIDKPDVRTVIHTALPSTLEGFYQEIGRAGRDGAPSRAILLHSFVDAKMLEFFHRRDYPDTKVLDQIFAELTARPVDREALRAAMAVEPAIFDKALEKLWLHGGAEIAPDETVRRGAPDFAKSYEKQAAYRLDQIGRMRRFAEKTACRMLQLVRHFGDERDEGTPCGQCDVCAPENCVAQARREPSPAEKQVASRILATLTQRNGITVGQLHRELFPAGDVDRRTVEHVLGGLVRAHTVALVDDSFEKEGAVVTFQRVYFAAPDGASPRRPEAPEFRMPIGGSPSTRLRVRKREQGKGRRTADGSHPSSKDQALPNGAAEALFQALRAWRLAEAKRSGLPAFRVLSDRTLLAIAAESPDDEDALLRVHGIGPALAKRYGSAVLGIVARYPGRATRIP
ncbi:MAG: DNA topoisomerase 3 [Polyangiaceae bacterium]|jgi:DNA topoisomerase-3